jgi:hypothetical protein
VETFFLVVLHILNFFWLWLMVKGIYRRVTVSKQDLAKSQEYKV